MLEYAGKYGTCHVMTDSIEEQAVTEIYGFLNHPAAEGATIRVMPDVHAGGRSGVVIGMTATYVDKVIPGMIGVDIGCGVLSYKFPYERASLDMAKLDAHIRESVPSGTNVHGSPRVSRTRYSDLIDKIQEIVKRMDMDGQRVLSSLGTLGGGNHFIELGAGMENELVLTIHSGSRNFGLQVATYYQRMAKEKVGSRQGLEWLEGADAEAYLRDMVVAQEYADLSRKIMAQAILPFFGVQEEQLLNAGMRIQSIHNYINLADKIIRKGAISAYAGQLVVIPWNMRDGLIIGLGKGNRDWNFSAPHGAGRVMSRGDAKRNLSMEEFEKTMKEAGVWSSCVTKANLEEAPGAYKSPEQVQASLGETVDVLYTVRPIYNYKDA